MDPEWVRIKCVGFPAVTEHEIWGNDLTFKVRGKMFAHVVLEPAAVWLSFKVTHENFHMLTERANIVPAPYLARAQWVALAARDAMGSAELGELLRESYDLVVAKLPKKLRMGLESSGTIATPRSKKKVPRKTITRKKRKR